MTLNSPSAAAAATPSFSLGIDSGTSKLMATAIDNATGKPVWHWMTEMPPTQIVDGLEVRPLHDWDSALLALFENLRHFVTPSRIERIGVTGTTPNHVLLGADGRPVRPHALVWKDPKRNGPRHPRGTNDGLRKLAVVAENWADSLSKTRCVLDHGGYLIHRLTHLETANAGSLVQKMNWSEKGGFDLAGLEGHHLEKWVEKIPTRVLMVGEEAGPLAPEVARRFGFSPEARVIDASYDTIAVGFACGLHAPGDRLVVSLGTSLSMLMLPIPQDYARAGGWVWRPGIFPHGARVIFGGFEAGLQSIRLVRERLKLNGEPPDEELERRVAEAERTAGADTLALPFANVPLRAPLLNYRLPTAIFCGDAQLPEDLSMLVALRRGIAYYVRYAIDDLERHGVPVGRVSLAGGGTKSPSFKQLIADVVQRPVVDARADAAAVGAATLAATANQPAFVRELLFRKLHAGRTTFQPDPKRESLYEAGYAKFRRHLLAACMDEGFGRAA